MKKQIKKSIPAEPQKSETEVFYMRLPPELREKIRQHADSEMRTMAKQVLIILTAYYKTK